MDLFPTEYILFPVCLVAGVLCLLASKNERYRRKVIEANGEEFGGKVLKWLKIGGYGLLIMALFQFTFFFD